MNRFFAALLLGVAIFTVFYWMFFGGENPAANTGIRGSQEARAVPESELGADLFAAQPFPEVKVRDTKRARDPVVIPGYLTALDQQEVPSQVPGQMLYIGEGISEGAVQAAGVAAFLAEPCDYAIIYLGERAVPTFYRRFYDGQIVRQEQMVGQVDYTKALGNVLEKKAKVNAALAEERSAKAAAEEGEERLRRAKNLGPNVAAEEYGEKLLTKIKLFEEYEAKKAGVTVARSEETQASILLHLHDIRSKLPYNKAIIKTITKPRGYPVKELEPVMQLQSLDRLLAEAQLNSQYRDRLKENMTATIEPTEEKGADRRLQGHRKDITCVAVTKDAENPLILSGGEDGQVLVWTRTGATPERTIIHPEAVQSLACTPPGADKNLCAVGLSDGTIYLWDLTTEGTKPLKAISRDKAHGDSVTCLAFSPDGKSFASGAADGSLKLWVTESAEERYPFDPSHGVDNPHNGHVTSLTFLPQCRLVSAARDNSVRVWKLKQKGAVLQENGAIVGREGKVSQLGVSQDGRYLLFDQGRTLQMFAVADGRPINTLETPGGTTPFETVAIFSPDGSMLLTAGAAEGRLQLWRTPTESERGFEIRQYSAERFPVTCAAFAPAAGQGGVNSFAVSASKHSLYIWPVPSKDEVSHHRIENVPLKIISSTLDAGTGQQRIGFEVNNLSGRLLPGRPVTIVID